MNLGSLKAYAIDKKVPIVEDDVIQFLGDLITKHQIKDVLEIGTAIGYSALAIASFGCSIKTFERDEYMVDEAKKHFDMFDRYHQITLYPFDALTFDQHLGLFDLIFLDAAKSQYETLFNKYAPMLKVGGYIVCDNLHFHHLDPNKVNRHTQGLLRKLKKFKLFLENHPTFKTTFFDIGDGLSVSKKVSE